jgi:hypothetical protein
MVMWLAERRAHRSLYFVAQEKNMNFPSIHAVAPILDVTHNSERRHSLSPFARLANTEDYYQMHGTLYRNGPKTSKRARKTAAIRAARLEARNAVRS